MTYKEYIQNIINTRGQWGISKGEPCERHHIIPRCMGGTGNAKYKHENIIWLYPREHFIAHKLLAEENPDNYSLVYAYHMMSTMSKDANRHIEITPEEYEEAKLLWLPFAKELASNNGSGRHWYTNGTESIMEYECPEGFWPGRSDSDKENIGKSSIGRIVNKNRHWYTNGTDQVMLYECPDGWWAGTLPMSEEAKLSHKESMINNPKLKTRNINRGYESLYSVNNRIDFEEFKIDFLINKLTDEELARKYNCTKKMIGKYRVANGLLKKLLKE